MTSSVQPPQRPGPQESVIKVSLWIGILTTILIGSIGWISALAWVISQGGLAALVDVTDEIFLVAAVSLLCAIVASVSAWMALRMEKSRVEPTNDVS
jgi:hypothetical protein